MLVRQSVAEEERLTWCYVFENPAVRVACRFRVCTHFAVFLVLAPHFFAEPSGCLTRSVWGYNVVVDQS